MAELPDVNLPPRAVLTMAMNLQDLWPNASCDLVQMPLGTDVWDLHLAGLWVLIPTNTQRRHDGTAVMCAGLALDAARRFTDLPARYGRSLAAGNTRVVIGDHRLLLGPTKTHWRDPATLALVDELLAGVASWAAANPAQAIAVPSPGCGRGGLAWERVRAAAMTHLAHHRVALLEPSRQAG